MISPVSLAFTVFISVAAASQTPEEGALYSPKEAAFELRFPAEPTVQKKPQLFGSVIIMAGIQRKSVEEFGYVCQWLIRDKAFDSPEAENIYLIGQQIGSVTGSKGKLLHEKKISLNGINGREFAVQVSDNNVFRCRVFLAGKRVINVQVWGKDLQALDSEEVTG